MSPGPEIIDIGERRLFNHRQKREVANSSWLDCGGAAIGGRSLLLVKKRWRTGVGSSVIWLEIVEFEERKIAVVVTHVLEQFKKD